MQIFKFQRHSCRFSFLFLPRPTERPGKLACRLTLVSCLECIDLFCIPVNKGTNSRFRWTKYSDLYEIACPPKPRPHFFIFALWSVMQERSISFYSDYVPPRDGKYFVFVVNRDRDQTPSNCRRLQRKQGFLPHKLRLVTN